MKNAASIALSCFLLAASWEAFAQAQAFRFGILQRMPDGSYEMATESTRIPRLLQNTGFRFGIAFENPSGEAIEWYEVIRLPAEIRQLSGGLRRSGPREIRSDAQRTTEKAVVVEFWFDEGDPLGRHTLELHVNGRRAYSVDFDVLQP